MLLLEDLKNECGSIVEIYFNAKENFLYCYYLHVPGTKEEAEYLNVDRDLKFIRHSLWRLSIIELAKLFSDRKFTDKFNLFHFLSKLKPGGKYAHFKFDPSQISKWEAMINTHENLISNIIVLRDKIYAHTDPDKDNYKSIEIYFRQIEDLFELIEKVLSQLYLILFDTHLELQTPTFDRQDFDLLKVLAAAHHKKIEKINSLFDKKDSS